LILSGSLIQPRAFPLSSGESRRRARERRPCSSSSQHGRPLCQPSTDDMVAKEWLCGRSLKIVASVSPSLVVHLGDLIQEFPESEGFAEPPQQAMATDVAHHRRAVLLNNLSVDAWPRHRCGDGAKRPRHSDWMAVPLTCSDAGPSAILMSVPPVWCSFRSGPSSRRSSRWRDGAGRVSWPSRGPRASWGWMRTRYPAGRVGIGTSPWR
jgi:hypothetical protein